MCGLDEAYSAADVIAQLGDSGGPVLSASQTTSTSTSIAGTISAQATDGHTVLFTDSSQQLQVLGVSPATS